MKTNSNLILLLFIAVSISFTSCKKEPGCMDPNSLTFNADAQEDDGSCVYAFDLAQGTWNITPECDDIEIPLVGTISMDEQLPDSIQVQAEGNSTLYIEINTMTMNGEIDYLGNITVEEQTISLDFGLGVPTDVQVEGSGSVSLDNTGTMDLTYSFEIPLMGTQSIDCTIDLNK